MGNLVLAGATSGSTTITPTDTVTVTCTLPSTGGTLQTSGSGFTTNGVAYASSTSALTTGSALTFDGNKLTSNALSFGYNTSYYNTDNSISNYSAGNFLYVSGNSTGGTGGLFLQGAGNQKQAIILDGISTGGNIAFQTNGSERMRLTSGGNLLVGTTTGSGNNEKVNFTGNVADFFYRNYNTNSSSPAGMTLVYSNAIPNNTSNEFLYCQDSTTLRMSVRSNGGVANYSANNVNLSDATIKKDITPAKSYLSILNQIPVVTFLLNDQTDTDLNLGVTAQSVQAVAPELVGTMNIGTKEAPNVKLAIYETDLKYAMLKAIQELSAQVTTLTTRLTALENK
jgi:hypothetical protein